MTMYEPMVQAGMRGPLYGELDDEIPAELGVETIPWIQPAEMTALEFAAQARARVGDGPAFLSLDLGRAPVHPRRHAQPAN